MATHSSFPTVLQTKLFLGAAYTGKTQSLLGEIESLLRGGVDASEIRVFCATPDAAQSLSARLQALCSGAEEIEVTTPRAFFLCLLSTKEAQALTGRKARLLLPFEYDFFLEDLKTTGIRPKRLREMLAFFYKGFSELADDDEDWLITNEELELLSTMRSCLGFTGAVLESELANLAVHYLRTSEGGLREAEKNHILVDDFQLLSRASQFASCLLAKEGLYLSANRDASIEVYESYPYPDGVDECIQANPDAVINRLTTSYSCYLAKKASLALSQEKGIDALSPEHPQTEEKVSLQLVEGENPQDEIARVTNEVVQLLNSGHAAKDIVISAPHAAWMRFIVAQLKAKGVLAELLPDVRFLKCDIRSNEKSFNARFLTLLNLVADPTDAVAWRSWCGFGDYLANSNGMRTLRNLAQAQGQTLDAVLKTRDLQLNRSDGLDAIASTQRIMKARDEALALIDRLRGLKGQDLLEALVHELAGPGAQIPERIFSLVAGHEAGKESESAATMIRRVKKRLEFPIYSGNDVIRVALYKNVTGMNPRFLFLTGFMNGFFPKHDFFDGAALTVEKREKRSAQDLSLLASVVSKASDALVVSYSKELVVEDAQRLGLVINRIAFENNKRVAKTEPSIFLKFITV